MEAPVCRARDLMLNFHNRKNAHTPSPWHPTSSTEFEGRYMEDIVHRLGDEEIKLLKTLSRRRRERRAKAIRPALLFGGRVSDRVAAVVGSWRFVIIQSVVMVVWLALNIVAWTEHWDPYPFILLNLVLSFQAAYTAPIILMTFKPAVCDRPRRGRA